jgi:hypothetical protein
MNTFSSRAGKTIVRMDILPPEITTGPKGRVKARGPVVDAQFVPVTDGGWQRSRPRSHNDNSDNRTKNRATGKPAERVRSGAPASVPNGFVGKVERVLNTLSADLFCALVAAAFVLVFASAGGFSFLFNDSGEAQAEPSLDITHITMTPRDADGMRVLLINGIVENRTSDAKTMPAIRAELMAGDTLVASTLIAPPASAIAAGHSRGFSARVPHPGGKLPDLRLTFAERDASRL